MNSGTNTKQKAKTAGRVSLSITGLTEDEVRALEKLAEQNERTVAAQVRYMLKGELNADAEAAA